MILAIMPSLTNVMLIFEKDMWRTPYALKRYFQHMHPYYDFDECQNVNYAHNSIKRLFVFAGNTASQPVVYCLLGGIALALRFPKTKITNGCILHLTFPSPIVRTYLFPHVSIIGFFLQLLH